MRTTTQEVQSVHCRDLGRVVGCGAWTEGSQSDWAVHPLAMRAWAGAEQSRAELS